MTANQVHGARDPSAGLHALVPTCGSRSRSRKVVDATGRTGVTRRGGEDDTVDVVRLEQGWRIERLSNQVVWRPGSGWGVDGRCRTIKRVAESTERGTQANGVRLTCNRGPFLASEEASPPCRGYQVEALVG